MRFTTETQSEHREDSTTLCVLRVLCASVVNAALIFTQSTLNRYRCLPDYLRVLGQRM
jgi:hypothetical protein